MVGDRALRTLERDRELAHRGRPLVEQAQDRVAEGMAERLDLGRLGERDSVGEIVVGRRFANHVSID
jgi:hypothetical protein